MSKFPKGKPDYRTLGKLGVMKRFPLLWNLFREDCLQEVEVLALEAERWNRWYHGKRAGVVGYRRFIRMVWRHFNCVARNYGLYRKNGTGSYLKREVEWNETIERFVVGN